MTGMKIGLMLPLGADETNGFADLRAMALEAEASGLDSVWGADHLIYRDDEGTVGIHECWTVLTAVAAITSRVEIGPMVLALPFRNPALVAKMAAELDEVSDGRLILGLGCGWHEPEYQAFGYPFDHRVGRFEEALEVIVRLLREGSVTYAGQLRARRRNRPARAGPSHPDPCRRPSTADDADHRPARGCLADGLVRPARREVRRRARRASRGMRRRRPGPIEHRDDGRAHGRRLGSGGAAPRA
jgi:alkanesulfonate monooxygenase SsuD/methylene tetrahydromethanopterin reductase-like flavin-dependent oxidoreductase (luciferase family)